MDAQKRNKFFTVVDAQQIHSDIYQIDNITKTTTLRPYKTFTASRLSYCSELIFFFTCMNKLENMQNMVSLSHTFYIY